VAASRSYSNAMVKPKLNGSRSPPARRTSSSTKHSAVSRAMVDYDPQWFAERLKLIKGELPKNE